VAIRPSVGIKLFGFHTADFGKIFMLVSFYQNLSENFKLLEKSDTYRAGWVNIYGRF
jgi:hypothetical protein